MSTNNHVTLVGFVGKDAESKNVESGNHVTRFTMATEDGYFNKGKDEFISRTNWHTVIAWNKLSEKMAKHIKKGWKVMVVGKVTSRIWEKEDQTKQTVVEIEAFKIERLVHHTQGVSPFPNDAPGTTTASSPASPSNPSQEPGGDLDDLPF